MPTVIFDRDYATHTYKTCPSSGRETSKYRWCLLVFSQHDALCSPDTCQHYQTPTALAYDTLHLSSPCSTSFFLAGRTTQRSDIRKWKLTDRRPAAVHWCPRGYTISDLIAVHAQLEAMKFADVTHARAAFGLWFFHCLSEPIPDIPGRIQSEEFDLGESENMGYYDTTPGNENQKVWVRGLRNIGDFLEWVLHVGMTTVSSCPDRL